MKNNHPSNDEKESKEIYVHEERNNGVLNGVILIMAGVILLLNTMGFLSWDIWETLIRFWPVLLILWGVELLLGATLIGRVAVAIIAFLTFLFVVSYAYGSISPLFNQWLKNRFPLWPSYINQPKKFIIPRRSWDNFDFLK